MNSSQKTVARNPRRLSHLRWTIGTPYFVQGTKSLTEIPILFFIKFQLGMDDAGGQLFDALRSIGWMIKPVWGYISDRVALFGYHRKSWYVLMACLAVVFWFVAAVISYLGITIPLIYFVVFNLAFSTYAFVDVVTDAIMVTEGRRLRRVGTFVNFQWLVLSVANAGALFLGGWLQNNIEAGSVDPWMVFFLAGIPPLFTAFVGIRYISEKKQLRPRKYTTKLEPSTGLNRAWPYIRSIPGRLNRFRKNNHTLWLLMLFIFFWKFSPSVGYIERSYLIDERGFTGASFGIILSVGGVTFLISILVYRWVVGIFRRIQWHHYLYAMVAIGVLYFPLSFFLYLDPDHPWWRLVYFTLPDAYNPLPAWNRYQWFRLINGSIFSFAMIPAFLIPLTINGHTVKVTQAAIGYAFLTALANATNIVEDVIGAGLFKLFSSSWFGGLRNAFQGSMFEIANSLNTRTLILEMFIYISLLFTLLTVPFIELLRRDLKKQGIKIVLSEADD
jgi:MFS family permease